MKTLFLFFLIFGISNTVYTQNELQPLGDDRFVCGILTSKFRHYISKQESSNWCWAACVQMVLAYEGMEVPQKGIVAFTLGDLANKPANCETLASAANGWGDSNGNNIKAFTKDYESDDEVLGYLIESLMADYPVIIGLDMPGQRLGHFYVLTSVRFYMDTETGIMEKDEGIQGLRVVLQDPWPTNPSKVEISWNDFYNRLNCLTFVINKKK